MIRIQQLNKGYADNQVLRGIDLQVAAGEFVVILGQSGAGKSTLLRCINRLALADSGVLEVGGVDAMQASQQRELRRRVAMIFQHHNVVPRLSVLKNVLTGRLAHCSTLASLLQLFRREDIELARDCLVRVELSDKAGARADSLSGGQLQRVGIARALAQRPEVILADEPVASLDPSTAQLVMRYLREATRTLGITVVCNLHQVDLARAFGDRIVGLASGRLVFDGPAQTLDDAALQRIYHNAAPRQAGDSPLAEHPVIAAGTRA